MSLYSKSLVSATGNSKTRINTASPSELVVSTVQDILMNQGYLYASNPYARDIVKMSANILSTFEIVPSTQQKDYSLIQKQTSDFSIDNPAILDPQISFLKQTGKTAKELGMTFEVQDSLFEQDYKLTSTENSMYVIDKNSKIGSANISLIGTYMCAEQLSVYSGDNKYMIDKQVHTKAPVAATGKEIRSKKEKPGYEAQPIFRGIGASNPYHRSGKPTRMSGGSTGGSSGGGGY